MKIINILVTGAGGGVGQGIIKSLKMIKDLEIKIVAADMHELSPGLYAADSSYIVEHCNSEKYFENLVKIFKKELIDFYIPGTDLELLFCAENKDLIKDLFNVHTIISSIDVIKICEDKFKTALFLKKFNLNYPKTQLLKSIDLKNIIFPVILKPSNGYRSIGVYKVNNIIELNNLIEKLDPNKYVLQEYIGDEDFEYTCTVVKVADHFSPVLTFKRILRSGDTYRAEPVKFKAIEKYVLDVASKLDIDGGCNFQLRLDKFGKPKIFEINSRFSGTTPFCAQIGFNPLEFYLKKTLGLEPFIDIDYSSIIMRYWSEVVVKKSIIEKIHTERSIKPSLSKQFKLF